MIRRRLRPWLRPRLYSTIVRSVVWLVLFPLGYVPPGKYDPSGKDPR